MHAVNFGEISELQRYQWKVLRSRLLVMGGYTDVTKKEERSCVQYNDVIYLEMSIDPKYRLSGARSDQNAKVLARNMEEEDPDKLFELKRTYEWTVSAIPQPAPAPATPVPRSGRSG